MCLSVGRVDEGVERKDRGSKILFELGEEISCVLEVVLYMPICEYAH